MAEMSLKEAKRIAGRVGARIVEKPGLYTVILAGRAIEGVTQTHFEVFSPRQAATCAVIETGRQAIILKDFAKQVYAEEDIL